MSALAARGRSNDASGNACVRYVRLPNGTNTKPRASGTWSVRLESWQPNVRWTLDDACAAVGVDLDSLRIAAQLPKAPSTSTGQQNHAGELVAGITATDMGERAYHDSITRLAASLVASGMFPGAVVEHLYSLMDAARPSQRDADEYRRWESRRQEIPRAVKSAEKFAPEERKPASITVNLSLAGSPDEPVAAPGDPVPVDWSALEAKKPVPTSWAVDGWLPHKHVTLLAANGGVGKSNISLQMAVAMATGSDFMGLATEQGKVLIISGEDDVEMVHFRVANICQDAGVSMSSLADQVVVYDMTQQDCVLWREGAPTSRMQWLADTVVRHKPAVVILDNASDLYADNENDRTAVRGFLRCLKTIAGVTGAAVLLLAHVDKASVRNGSGQDTNSTFSGSTAWNNSARSRWAMVRGADKREVVIKHEKCNVGPEQEDFSVEFDASAKVFRRFGTVPGAQAAANLMRNSQRAAMLQLLAAAEHADQKLSLSVNANNNAYRVLKANPKFPRIDRSEFFSILYDMQRERLLEEVEYMNERKKFKRIVLTKAGQARVAVGSGAAPTWAQREGESDES